MSFSPILKPEFRYWECAIAAAAVRTDADRAAIWGHWEGADPLMDGSPQCGYWKAQRGTAQTRRWVPVAIWKDTDGTLLALTSGANREDAAKVWTLCGRNPISYKDYLYAVANGKFPGEVEAKAPRLDNLADDPNTQYRQDMVSLLAQVEDFLKKIDGPITKETADALANYRDLVTQSEKTAKALFAAEVADQKAAIARQKEVWETPLASAAAICGRIKALITPFLREREAKGETLRLGGQGTGTGRPRRTGLRGSWTATVTDWEAVVPQFSGHPAVQETIQKLLNAIARSPQLRETPIEGVEFIEERNAA